MEHLASVKRLVNQSHPLIWLLGLLLLLPPATLHAQDAITFPALTGDYPVGILELFFTDPSREEIFSDDPGDVRELITTIYYPADAAGDSQPAPYASDALKAEAGTWPGIDPARWSDIQTGLLLEASAAPNAYPVILFSPGLAMLPLFYSSLLAEIASHGYVVISISRTYTTALTVFPDGRSIRSNAAGTDVDGHRGDAFFDVQARRAAIGAVWAGDIRFVIDQLAVLNAEHPLLSGHLDKTRIGLVGHSFGGSSGAEAAYLDSRVGAVISMDSHLDGDVALEGLSQPYMYMEPANPPYEDPAQTPSEEQLTAMGMTTDDLAMLLLRVGHMKLLETSEAGYRLRLVGAQHLTFTTDLHVFAPHFPGRITRQMTGAKDGERAMQIINQYALAFFDQHLKGQDSPLLNNSMTNNEIVFERF